MTANLLHHAPGLDYRPGTGLDAYGARGSLGRLHYSSVGVLLGIIEAAGELHRGVWLVGVTSLTLWVADLAFEFSSVGDGTNFAAQTD